MENTDLHSVVEQWLQKLLPESPSVENQKIVKHIYRSLAKGGSVSQQQLAAGLGMPREAVEKAVNEFPTMYIGFDDQNRIFEFGGFGPDPTPNIFQTQGNTLYAWCAWDALFIPPILNETAHVETTCPETHEKIQITIAPTGVIEAKPHTAAMTFALPGMEAFSDAEKFSFMKTVFFFSSAEVASQWVSKNPGPVVISLDEGFALGRTINQYRFHDITIFE